MTQNKFWLVRGSNIERQHNKKEEAEYSARRLAEEHELTFGVFKLVSTFEGKATKTVNVVETSFEVTPEESLAVEPKFKVGDKVLLDNYYECIVDDYFDETKSYKLSIISGGYNIAKEIRVTKK